MFVCICLTDWVGRKCQESRSRTHAGYGPAAAGLGWPIGPSVTGTISAALVCCPLRGGWPLRGIAACDIGRLGTGPVLGHSVGERWCPLRQLRPGAPMQERSVGRRAGSRVSTRNPGHVSAGGQLGMVLQGHQGSGGAEAPGNSVGDIPEPLLLPGPRRPCRLLSEPVGRVNGRWALSGRLEGTKLKGWQLGMWPGEASLGKHRIKALPAPLTLAQCQIM